MYYDKDMGGIDNYTKALMQLFAQVNKASYNKFIIFIANILN